MLVRIVIGLVAALAGSWLLVTVAVLLMWPRTGDVRHLIGFLPEVFRLLRALTRDPAVPRSVRWRLWAAVAYNLQPFTLIPDFVPVVGFADNIVVVLWAVRSAVRAAGKEAVARHWRGTQDQLAVLFRIARLGAPPGGGPPASGPPSEGAPGGGPPHT